MFDLQGWKLEKNENYEKHFKKPKWRFPNVSSRLYTVFHEESESEVQNRQILQENLKTSISKSIFFNI